MKMCRFNQKRNEEIVELDAFIESIINQFAKLSQNTKSIVEDVFYSADVLHLVFILIVRF